MYDDNKNPGQWEVVGGKASNKTKGGKSTSSKSNGSGTKSGGHAPIIKVDELGKGSLLSSFLGKLSLLI